MYACVCTVYIVYACVYVLCVLSVFVCVDCRRVCTVYMCVYAFILQYIQQLILYVVYIGEHYCNYHLMYVCDMY